ncbi:MAG TPA: adenylate/guanylate cyclase domain-containing protein, partial [Chloroflexia bacterium]|nr:adenylate/guanylate cyclase domain-containing protein [Chloroflexia bacterium]
MSTVLAPPTGTVTFIFTDLDLDTRALGTLPGDVEGIYSEADALLKGAVEANGGFLYKTVGHATQSAFSTAQQAAAAAIDAQQAIAGTDPRPSAPSLRPSIRIAMHSGVTEVRERDYFGPLLNRVARMLAASHGGQIVLSQATEELLRDALPSGSVLRDLGEHRLRDLTDCEHIYQLVGPGLQSEFPPLKSMGSRPNNLPPQPTELVGRARDVEACCELLRRDDVWLVTLTGPGGIGKSRLGIQVGAEMLDDFSDGVFFVPLASVTDPEMVVPAICQVLDIREARGTALLDSLKEYL